MSVPLILKRHNFLGIFLLWGFILGIGGLTFKLLELNSLITSNHKILSSLVINGYVIREILEYTAEILFIHSLLMVLLWGLFLRIKTVLNIKKNEFIYLVLTLLFLSTVVLLSLNSLLFPHSSFRIDPLWFNYMLLIAILPIFILILYLTLKESSIQVFEYLKKDYKRTLSIFIGITIPITVFVSYPFNKDTTLNESPHIIIIGIDGLRPDHTAIESSRGVTPHIDAFIANSLSFPQAYTPLARTSPSWASILTGNYPITHGMRFNLTNPDKVERPLPLLTALKDRGYNTTFISDERRFNNIDESYGFDSVVGPEIGVGDFLIGTLHDNPILNLTGLTIFSRLFEFSHLNRAAYITYNPKDFTSEIDSYLKKEIDSAPNFIAIHLELLHWPYLWKDAKPISPEIKDSSLYTHALYMESLKEVDIQFGEIIQSLKQHGFLDNTHVFLISDHGESFNFTEDAIKPFNDSYPEYKIQSAWHGTSIFDNSQNKIVFAYNNFSSTTQSFQEKNATPVSLIDITPTISDILDLDNHPETEGTSILNITKRRPIFLETGFSTDLFLGDNEIEIASIVNSSKYYEIAEGGRMQIKEEYYNTLLATKQYGVYEPGWILGLVPVEEDSKVWILLDTENKTWYLRNNFPPYAPWRSMRKGLCGKYRSEPSFGYEQYCKD